MVLIGTRGGKVGFPQFEEFVSVDRYRVLRIVQRTVVIVERIPGFGSRGFQIRAEVAFLQIIGTAFSDLTKTDLMCCHYLGKSDTIEGLQDSQLHIWYLSPDELYAELEGYLAASAPTRRAV